MARASSVPRLIVTPGIASAITFARRLTRQAPRTEEVGNAGLVTRALGTLIDGALVNAAFIGLSALFTFAVSGFFEEFDRSSAPALALGFATFLALSGGYLIFDYAEEDTVPAWQPPDLVAVDGKLGRMGGAAPAAEGHNMDHLCLRVEPFDRRTIVDHLSANGATITDFGDRYGADGLGPSQYLLDPEGNAVELKGPPDSQGAEGQGS